MNRLKVQADITKSPHQLFDVLSNDVTQIQYTSFELFQDVSRLSPNLEIMLTGPNNLDIKI